ncbi:MAG: hypothetical protein PHC90_14905, partial [Syntrophorhabdaceae bacterium]|nr:hypothetical protein [Syntrophorhabdaceae bacterium]
MTKLIGNLPHLWAHLRGNSLTPKRSGDEPPLRSELFSASQMEQHGKTLAGAHTLGPDHFAEKLLARLGENENVLLNVRELLTEALKGNRRVTPAGEWLLDNFYLIEEQIRTAKRHLPKGYSKGLPRLKNGPSAGLPRVYDIALEIISHGDGRVDPDGLGSFVAAYQTVAALKLGELWAIPIMLRLALIENLRRVTMRIASHRTDRNLADYWADRITATAEQNPKDLILVIADMARSNPPMVSSFIAELTRRLKGQGPTLALPLTWIEQQLSESGLTIEQLIQSENQQQAADQLSISNSIGSLRFLGAMDWRTFVETMSIVERTLCEDPAGMYGGMDFATRDQYRHVVENIAKSGPLSENEVARVAIRLAGERKGHANGGGREDHVGFYLIDKGLEELEGLAGVRLSFTETVRKVVRRSPLFYYLGAICIITAIFTGYLLTEAHSMGLCGPWLWFIGALSLLCVSQLAIALVNWLTTRVVTPRFLPRMDFSRGIPRESSALVIVPTMLT